MTILIATSTTDFDPTEVAIPWEILHRGGQEIVFATDTGKIGSADQRMLDGHGLGILKPLLIAQRPAQDAYNRMLADEAFKNPISYQDINIDDYSGLILPGGHAKGIIPYLESKPLQNAISQFFDANKSVGAICHGVVAACRAKDPKTGKSILYGRKTTALLERQELLAYKLTKHRLGDYYLTYPQTVEDEVISNLKSPDDFIHGPTPILRDNLKNLSRGFTVRDGNYLSARWPGDVHKFATQFLEMLNEH